MPKTYSGQNTSGTDRVLGAGQSIYGESDVPNHELGAELMVGTRLFRYARAGAVALSKGKMCQSAAPVSTHLNCAVAVAAVEGVRQVTITLGATNAVTANQYKDGYLHVNDVNGEGQCLRIKSHPAAAAEANLVVTLYDPLTTALTTSSEATLTKHECDGVIVAPNAALTAPVVGVPIRDVTAAYYFWLQVGGPCAVLTQGTVVIGQKVGLGGTADGACGPVAADVTDTWGRVMQVNGSGDYSLINLCLN